MLGATNLNSVSVKHPYYPPIKVLAFTGALGQALAKISGRFRDSLYNPSPSAHWTDRQQKPPPPYLLIPPQEEKTDYQANDTLTLGIVLFGSAVDYFLIIFAALGTFGRIHGHRQTTRTVCY